MDSASGHKKGPSGPKQPHSCGPVNAYIVRLSMVRFSPPARQRWLALGRPATIAEGGRRPGGVAGAPKPHCGPLDGGDSALDAAGTGL